MTCINTSHQEFQSLLKETGKSSFELELDVAAWQQTQNSDLFPTAQELYPDEISLDYYTDEDFKKMSEEYDNFLVEEYEYLSKPNEISYKLKAVEILNTTKAKKTFEKGDKNSWTLNKILTELQIPKEQRELILEFGVEKRTDILEKLRTFQFTVEINTTTQGYNVRNEEDGYDSDLVQAPLYDPDNGELLVEAIYRSPVPLTPTQYYSYLTVPGGANYTEQEIATPQIVPAIKGHAQFATNNGIGWFRSDDKVDNATITVDEEPDLSTGEPRTKKNTIGGVITKTRRILEVQSDLFQKGRESRSLTDINTATEPEDIWYVKKVSDSRYLVQNGSGEVDAEYNNEMEAATLVEDYNRLNIKLGDEKGNQFLQLLNKNSNWVTFFIKGIVQDSEKRGYEKVLFPSGDTASKVEGHTTVEEFKKQKEDRLKLLEKDKANFIERLEDGLKSNIKTQKSLIESSEKEWQKDIHRKAAEELKLRLENKEFTSQTLKDLDNEINQLKQELASVERDGLAALKPIWNFYENVVSKITKKLYNSETVTDEYGNTWQEITLVENNVVPLPEDLNDFINFDKICLL